ncbi:MAG: TolC family outer membrane protein, partial [Acetobacteraceae bacterium]|nr:TolC family outer membrane protein [Acetobacteraceae bacterium]
MRNEVIALGGLLALVAGGAHAQPRTLQDALASAYSNNPTLQAARAQLRATDETVPQALAGWRPTVVLSSSVGYADGSYRTTANGFTNKLRNNRDIFSAQATATQPLFRGGATQAGTRQADNRVYAQRARLLATEQQLFSDTVTAYVNVIQGQQVLQLNINNEQVLQRQLQATQDRFRVGEITRTDVAQAEAALAGARATRETSAGNLQTARGNYRRYVGELPDQLVEPQPLKEPVHSQQEAVQLAANNNPNVIAALFDDAAARDNIDLQFANLMPQLSLQAQAARADNTTLIRQRTIGGQVLLNASVPIYQGGAEYSRVRQARQQEQQARKTVDDIRRQVIAQAT